VSVVFRREQRFDRHLQVTRAHTGSWMSGGVASVDVAQSVFCFPVFGVVATRLR
jgi:hypothetical protein